MSTFYQTNKSDAGTIVRREGKGSIQWSRGVKETAPSVYPQLHHGQMVALDTVTGEIIPVTADTDVIVGFVIVPNSDLNGQRATIQTQGVAIITCATKAGAVTAGAYVKVLEVNSNVTPNRPNSEIVAAAGYAMGITLTAAAAINTLQEVLLLSSSIKRP